MPARGLAATALTGVVAAVAIAATPAAASASGLSITVRYPVTGGTFIKAANGTVNLGPGTLTSAVDLSTGAVTASLKLPPATGSFTELGVVPVTATTAFIQDGPTTGTVNLNTGSVATTSHITLQITSLSVAGLPVPVGPSCKSATPATVSVTSQPGFSIVKGGNLSGTYTIPPSPTAGWKRRSSTSPSPGLATPSPSNSARPTSSRELTGAAAALTSPPQQVTSP